MSDIKLLEEEDNHLGLLKVRSWRIEEADSVTHVSRTNMLNYSLTSSNSSELCLSPNPEVLSRRSPEVAPFHSVVIYKCVYERAVKLPTDSYRYIYGLDVYGCRQQHRSLEFHATVLQNS